MNKQSKEDSDGEFTIKQSADSMIRQLQSECNSDGSSETKVSLGCEAESWFQ